MKIHYGLKELNSTTQTVVTIGAFDGVHLAHRKIASLVVDEARRLGLESAVVSFWPLPKAVLNTNSKDIEILTTQKEKEAILQEIGIDHFYIIPFTIEFSHKTAFNFVSEILIERLKTKKIILGYDHHFGRNREGGLAYLEVNKDQFNIDVEAIGEQIIHDSTISSTQIRKAIKEGNIEEANLLLGYNYSFSGNVVIGNQLGRTIGFPTANILIDEPFKLIPSNGVYGVQIQLLKENYFGIMNIGTRPTLNGTDRRIEVNIFDFNGTIYDSFLTTQVCFRIRDEQKFESLEALKSQIQIDKEKALNLFASRV